MPEMPEVHALAADLRTRLSGRAIARLEPVSFSALKTFDPRVDALAGTFIDEVSRHGKYLDIEASGLHLIVHLARAGWIRWRQAAPRSPARPGKGPLAARLVLDDGDGIDITEAGTRKRLALWLVRDPAEVPGIAALGPDPLDEAFTIEHFRDILRAAGRAQVKGVLRDQSRLAGIGNAYSDEILHAARMSPYHPAAMSEEESARLYEALRITLREAIERSAGLAAAELKREKKTGLRVHGKAGEACPICGGTIRQVVFADRSLEYCPGCQTGGKVLADRGMSRLLK